MKLLHVVKIIDCQALPERFCSAMKESKILYCVVSRVSIVSNLNLLGAKFTVWASTALPETGFHDLSSVSECVFKALH